VWAGGPFPLFHYESDSFSNLITTIANSLMTFLACTFVFYVAAITQTSIFYQLDSTLTRELTTFFLLSLYNMQEKPENNEIQNNGTFRADSEQMQVVGGKQNLFEVA